MPQGDGTGPRARGPRSGKKAGRRRIRGRDSAQQSRAGRDAGRRQGQGADKPVGRG